ncbi:MAG: tetratricopeptide repeat protein, partial [Nitrosotalea sp.]
AQYERRFNDAIAVIQKRIAEAEPGKPMDTPTKLLLPDLGYCQEWIGQTKEAHESFARAVAAIKPTPDSVVVADSLGTPDVLALAYAGLGDKDKALEQAKRAVADYATDAIQKPNAETVLAQIQARFGDADSAIAAIPHLLEVPAGITVSDLKFNPLWDPLRKDPRFQKLCEEKPK